MSRVVPVRAEDFVCPLWTDYIEEKLGESVLDGIKLRRYASYEALNFVDGRRSIFGIARAVSAEFEPVGVQEVYDFFRVLERAGLVRLKNI